MEVPAGSNGTAPWREESTWCTHRNSLLPSLLGGLWPQGVFSGTFPPPSQVEQPHAAAETCAEAMSGVRAAAPWGKNSLRLLWGNTLGAGGQPGLLQLIPPPQAKEAPETGPWALEALTVHWVGCGLCGVDAQWPALTERPAHGKQPW